MKNVQNEGPGYNPEQISQAAALLTDQFMTVVIGISKSLAEVVLSDVQAANAYTQIYADVLNECATPAAPTEADRCKLSTRVQLAVLKNMRERAIPAMEADIDQLGKDFLKQQTEGGDTE